MSVVYKFLDCTRIGFLSDGLLRFTPPADLNDPYECLAAFPDIAPEAQLDYLKKGIVERFPIFPTDSPKEAEAKVQKAFSILRMAEVMFKKDPWFFHNYANEVNIRKTNIGLGVLSLSRRWNSCLMWSHYTETYTGFCVGFHRGHNFFQGLKTELDEMHPLSAVKYTKDRVLISDKYDEANGYEVFLTKSLDWSYEDEERVLSTFGLATKKIEKVPYPIHLFKIPFDAISEIVVGHNGSRDLEQAALRAGVKLGVPVYKTCISLTSFDVGRTLLNS